MLTIIGFVAASIGTTSIAAGLGLVDVDGEFDLFGKTFKYEFSKKNPLNISIK